MMKMRVLTMLLSVGVVLTGCASSGESDYFELRENRVGLYRDRLISEIGQPTIQLESPPYFDVELVRYVYMNQPDAIDCVDVYVIEKVSGKIVEYICK